MEFKNLLSIFLVIVIIHIVSTSAKKARNPTGAENSEIQAQKELGKDVETSFSSEMQQLRELASKESGSIILKPKHTRRKNKHPHRRRRPNGGGRSNKKNRTSSSRPFEILKAKDDTKVKQTETTVHIDIDHDTKSPKRSRTRSRESRHLNLASKIATDQHRQHHHRRPRMHHHIKTGQLHHTRNNANDLIPDHGVVDKHVDA